MQQVKLLYVENVISRTMQGMWQEMAFMVRLENLSYRKNVAVHWAGEDGVWHTHEAAYYYTLPDHGELWLARIKCPLTAEQCLPGNIRFAIRYETEGQTFWDNNEGKNYELDADCGVVVYREVPVQLLFHDPVLHGGRVSLPVDVAVRSGLEPSRVRIHWSTDHWKTSQVARCYKRANQWEMMRGSAARNPNRYGWEIWSGRIPVKHEYRVQYAIECVTDEGSFWDNCDGENYQSRRSTLRVLTLNLHCFQEENQEYKFAQIAKAIDRLHIDLVCLQEVAENWNDGNGDWASNSARIINGYLSYPYHVHTDYSHLGFDRYREGVAILSRHEFTQQDAGYVSESMDVYDINARKVVMAQVHVPYFGPVNLFSVHLSWPEGGFLMQFDRLRNWADELHGGPVTATLLCGDFNIKAGSDAYKHVVDTQEYEDQYLKILNREAFDKVYRQGVEDVAGAIGDDGRIDYIFLKKESKLVLLEGQELFTDDLYGRVSDHTGYYAEFELA